MQGLKKFMSIMAFAGVVVLVSGNVASAHVAVKPNEVTTASFQTFTVGVPNERDTPTTKVKLLIPNGLDHVSPTQKTGWSITLDKSGNGETAKVTAITWTAPTGIVDDTLASSWGGGIAVGMRDDFTFSAKAPASATELQWKAYQTYADGTVVSWDQAESNDGHGGDGTSGPFSVTKVVETTAQDEALAKAQQAATDAKTAADWALYSGVAGIILGLAALFFATRKRK